MYSTQCFLIRHIVQYSMQSIFTFSLFLPYLRFSVFIYLYRRTKMTSCEKCRAAVFSYQMIITTYFRNSVGGGGRGDTTIEAGGGSCTPHLFSNFSFTGQILSSPWVWYTDEERHFFSNLFDTKYCFTKFTCVIFL